MMVDVALVSEPTESFQQAFERQLVLESVSLLLEENTLDRRSSSGSRQSRRRRRLDSLPSWTKTDIAGE